MNLLYINDKYFDVEKANTMQVVYMCQTLSKHFNKVVLAFPYWKTRKSTHYYVRLIDDILGFPGNFDVVQYNKKSIFKRIKFLTGIIGIYKTIKDQKPDIIYTRQIIPAILSDVFRKRKIVELHNFKLHYTSIIVDWIFKQYIIRQSFLDKCACIVLISENLKSKWIDYGLNENRIIVQHDAILERNFINNNQKIARKRLLINMNDIIVSYVGSLYDEYGVDVILKLADINPSLRFIIVGGPEEQKKKFQQMAINMNINNIEFEGFVKHKDVYDYLFAANILLMVWSYDFVTMDYCSPLKVFEYMAAGKIIVGHNFPTIREVLPEDLALLADPASFNDLNLSLQKSINLINNNKIEEKVRHLAFKYHTWDVRVKKILKKSKLNNLKKFNKNG